MVSTPDGFVDERRTAPPVREFHNGGRARRRRDRTALARVLHVAGLPNHEIADILGVHWAQVESVLKGEA